MVETPDAAPSQTGKAETGVTIVELMVVLSVLLIGMLAVTSSSLAAHTLRRADGERQLAGNALHSVMETARAVSNAKLDDVLGWGTAMSAAFRPGGEVGDTFDVPGLDPWEGEASVGTVRVVTDETLTDGEIDMQLGMPRDLDNDGAIDNSDVRAGARLLPVIVTLRWQGVSGRRQLVRGFYVLGY